MRRDFDMRAFVPMLAIAALGINGFNEMHQAFMGRGSEPQKVGTPGKIGISQRKRRLMLRRLPHVQRRRALKQMRLAHA